MINIVCLKWGDKFGPEYVNRLYAGVQRNTTLDVAFHCFTENPKDIHPDVIIHPLPNFNLTGWWNKLYLFSGDLPISGRIVFMDLDTLIVGNIDDLLSHNTGFATLRDWFKAEKDPNTLVINSSIMSFVVGQHTHIWTNFMKDPTKIAKSIHPAGDQEWIRQQKPAELVFLQDLFPNQLYSYKSHCLGGLPPNARIVCFHGKPSIPDSIDKTTRIHNRVCGLSPWVADHWRSDTAPHITKECYIVAGGPSLKGFDWSLLDNKFTIAINRSYEVLPNANIVYFTDNDFWKIHEKGILAHKGKKVKGSLPSRVIKHPEVEEYILTSPTGLEMTAGKLNHGHNSTYAAINLATQMGFKKIYLLGVDMKWGTPKDRSTSHWHNGHKRTDPESVYKKMSKCYETIVEPLKKQGVEVFNLNPDSALEVFPKLNPQQVFGDKYVAPIQEKSMEEDKKLLGDRVEQVITILGGKQVSKAIERVTKKPCGCARRKEKLNNLHRRLSRQNTPAIIEPVVHKAPQPDAPKPRIVPKAPQTK
jgi:hypothetical protein